MIEFMNDENEMITPSIKVIGIGGAGGNTINSLGQAGSEHICLIAANTDSQALNQSKAHIKLQLGVKATKGLGTGANPALGRHAAQEDLDKIIESLSSTDIVFLTAGMGGGTGSGALPVIANALKKEEVLTIAIVTTPFTFEGKRRALVAQKAIDEIKDSVDALIVIPNQRLLEIVDQKVSMLDSFALINAHLVSSVKGITDIITKPGFINVDFADLKAIMKGMGQAMMGTGIAQGEGRATVAAQRAISSPLLDHVAIKGSNSILINITGSSLMGLHEINEVACLIQQEAAEDAHIIIGTVIDDALEDDIMVTVIATGFDAPCALHDQDQQFIKNESGCAKEFKQERQGVQETTSNIPTIMFDTLPVVLNREQLDDLDIPAFMRKS